MAPVRAPTNDLLTPAKAPLLVQGVQFLKASADLVNGLRSTNPYISSISRNVKYFSLITFQIYFWKCPVLVLDSYSNLSLVPNRDHHVAKPSGTFLSPINYLILLQPLPS